jgi:hypothetical protein
MLLIEDAGCDELLILNMFIFYGKGAGSKGIPMSKQQHRGHESEVLDSGNRWLEDWLHASAALLHKKITPRQLTATALMLY